jgi:cation transport regulator ChaB
MVNPKDGNNKPVEKQKTPEEIRKHYDLIVSNLSESKKEYLNAYLENHKILEEKSQKDIAQGEKGVQVVPPLTDEEKRQAALTAYKMPDDVVAKETSTLLKSSYEAIKSNLSFHQKNYLEERLETDKIKGTNTTPANLVEYANKAVAMNDKEANYAAAHTAYESEYYAATHGPDRVDNPRGIKSEYLRVQENELNALAANGSPEQLDAYNRTVQAAKDAKKPFNENELEQLAKNLNSSRSEDANLVASSAVKHFNAGGDKDKINKLAVESAVNNDLGNSLVAEFKPDGKIKSSQTIDKVDPVSPPSENLANKQQSAPTQNTTEPAVATNTVTSPTGHECQDCGLVNGETMLAAAEAMVKNAGGVNIANNTAGAKLTTDKLSVRR